MRGVNYFKNAFCRVVVWCNFDRYSYEVDEVPSKYFWVCVAKCLKCGAPVNINHGSHDNEEDIQAACMSHFVTCSIFKRGKDARIQEGGGFK